MIRRVLFAAAPAALILAPVSALAQDEASSAQSNGSEESMDAMMGALGEMFAAEPLTAEQEARLPLAQNIAGKMMPEGSMSEMMDKMMGGTLGSLLKLAEDAAPKKKLAEKLGVPAATLSISNSEAAGLLSTFDPNWKERQEREAAVMPEMMASIVTVMEEPMRKAMAELYAINFNETELNEIDKFFSTETGANFARKSYSMASDPRLIAASMEAMPQMMGAFANIEQTIEVATADLPAERNFGELSSEERSKVVEATGLTEQQIETALLNQSSDWSM